MLIGSDASPDVPVRWHELDAAIHPITDAAFGDSVDATAVVIVRPDRIVAAVTTDLAATTAVLVSSF